MMRNVILSTLILFALCCNVVGDDKVSQKAKLNAQTGKDVIKFADVARIEKNVPRIYQFKIQDAESRQIRLHFDVRFDWDSLIGYTKGMKITVNGQAVTGSCLLNKPLKYKTRNGAGDMWAKPDASNFNVMYSPDFSDKIKTDKDFKYGLYEENQAPYSFVFDFSGLTQHIGVNEVKIEATYSAALIVKNLRLEIDKKTMPRINDPSTLIKPAPTGPLQDYQLKIPSIPEPQVRVSDNGSLEVKVNGGTFPIESKFSLPDGRWLYLRDGEKWQKLQKDKAFELVRKTPEYQIKRRIEIKSDHIKVYDTFINLRNEVTGVMFENAMALPEKPLKILRGGLDSSLTETRNNSNPSVTAQMEGMYVGLLGEDDILRNQGYFKKETQTLILGDKSLGLPPKESHTLEWSIYVLPDSDYYNFVNAVRRNWNSNFTWEGPLAFPYMGGKQLQKWNTKEIKPEVVKKFLKERPVNLLMTHVASNIATTPAKATKENPWLGHGTAILQFTWWGNMTKKMIEAFNETAPHVKVFAYMHKNICTEPGNWNKYRDSVALDDYSQAIIKSQEKSGYGRFVPTSNNSYGKALKKVYQYIVNDLNANIYMDEICLSVTEWAHYSKEWDNCTVQIDPVSHKVVRKLSIPNLLTKPWLEDMVKYLKDNKKQLLGNGTIATRTLQDHHFISFIEYGMGESGLISAHLSTPLAWNGYKLGLVGYRHLKESLSFGALAITWSGIWSDHLFPFTPIEIHRGYLIGKERIVTKLSGRFGWRDNSRAYVYVFDGQGKRVEKPNVREVCEGGNVLTEIRMPSNHLAILVRTPQKK